MGANGYINQAAVKRLALRYAADIGRDKVVTQVGAEVYAYLGRLIEQKVCAMVERHPSGFRTLKPF